MFCQNCGYQVNDGAQFCPSCGNPLAPAGAAPTATDAYGAAQPPESNPYGAAQAPDSTPYGAMNNNPSPQERPVAYAPTPDAPEPPAGYGAAQNPYGANAPYGGYAENGNPGFPPQPIQAAPPKKSKMPIIILVAVIAVAAIVAVVFFMNRGAEPSGGNSGGVSVHVPAAGNNGGSGGTGGTGTSTGGTGGTGTSTGSYSSLEDYFKKNPSEWDAIKTMVSSAETSDYSIKFDVNGNQLEEIMRFNKGFSSSELGTLRHQFETDSSIAELQDELSSILQMVESSTGLSGLSWYVEYQDANGTNIWSTTIRS